MKKIDCVKPLIEVCVASPQAALQAAEAGADRIEFNSALELDGLTPKPVDVARLSQLLNIPIVAMLRPHARSFRYDQRDVEEILASADALLVSGVAGLAFGALNDEGNVDLPLMRRVVEKCGSLKKYVVMHRAFDEIVDAAVALEQLIDIGVIRILTSGGAATAKTGIPQLARLVELSRGRIEILPGGGINADNAQQIINETGCTQIHGTFRVSNSKEIMPDLEQIRLLSQRSTTEA